MQSKRWMRRGLVLGLVMGCGFAIGSASSAEGGSGAASGANEAPATSGDPAAAPTTPPTPAAPLSMSPEVPPTPSEPSALPSAPTPTPKKSKDADGRARLNGTTWSLDLVRISGSEKEKGRNEKDTVTFGARTVSSDWLSKAGFPTSNYSLNIGDDGALVWETMQSHGEGKGIAFWRGEIRGDTMDGVLSQQPTGGLPEEFSFSGRQIGGASTPVTEVQPAPTPHAESTDAQQKTKDSKTSEKKDKKKKR